MIVLLEGIAGGVVGSVIVFGLLLLAATKVLPKLLPKIMRQMLATKSPKPVASDAANVPVTTRVS